MARSADTIGVGRPRFSDRWARSMPAQNTAPDARSTATRSSGGRVRRKRRLEPVQHLEVEGVAFLRAVEGDGAHRAVEFHKHFRHRGVHRGGSDAGADACQSVSPVRPSVRISYRPSPRGRRDAARSRRPAGSNPSGTTTPRRPSSVSSTSLASTTPGRLRAARREAGRVDLHPEVVVGPSRPVRPLGQDAGHPARRGVRETRGSCLGKGASRPPPAASSPRQGRRPSSRRTPSRAAAST